MLYTQPILQHLQLALNRHLPCLCLIHKQTSLPHHYLYLQLGYTPMDIDSEQLTICFLLSYYNSQPDPEAELQQHLQLMANLRQLRYLTIGAYQDVALHMQPIRQPQASVDIKDISKASWLLHLQFDPQQSSQLLHQSQRLSLCTEML
ncbi:hypothetical protein PVA44_07090 (plasmid) [Entomospira nematocerorum]|uniref:Uncharacterized protein n=1 Tax=Entomospira nematocerorum TaxID=2719987 RepID=A0A968KYL0_9SPIO|nr:hypothetical protein [Entomospira nematocera]NIZ47672.1 hypothetical protein [Entomospira nematocera]WDI34564.1 hypothetical protein PVA44_07090 [Entomospira nematocera]